MSADHDARAAGAGVGGGNGPDSGGPGPSERYVFGSPEAALYAATNRLLERLRSGSAAVHRTQVVEEPPLSTRLQTPARGGFADLNLGTPPQREAHELEAGEDARRGEHRLRPAHQPLGPSARPTKLNVRGSGGPIGGRGGVRAALIG
jgi:hypothetical protein